MVYCGRPSQGCERCRARRLKCDLGRPGCQKCARASQPCPGYRHLQDLMFRNETGKTVRKHEGDGARETLQKTKQRRIPSLDCNVINLSVRDQTNGGEGTNCPILNMAVAFLYTQYLKGSNFAWVPAVHKSLPASGMFGSIVHATAFAAYANHQNHSQSLVYRARSLYNQCLLQLRAAVGSGDPVDDEILASILLMSQFENLTSDGDEDSISNAWASHAYGATKLLASYRCNRPQLDQLSKTLVTLTMRNYNLYRLHTSRQRSLLQNKITSSSTDRYGTGDYDNFTGISDRSQVIFNIFWDFLDSPPATGASDVLRDLTETRKIDDQIVALMQEMELVIPFQKATRGLGDSAIFKSGLSQVSQDLGDAYCDHHDTRMWNSVRMVRLSVHDRVLSSIASISLARESLPRYIEHFISAESLEQHRRDSHAVIEEVSADICRSSLYFLSGDRPTYTSTHAAASYLAWPLFVAGRSCHDYSSFVGAQLRKIGTEFKIKSASLAADNLDNRKYRDDWLYASWLS